MNSFYREEGLEKVEILDYSLGFYHDLVIVKDNINE